MLLCVFFGGDLDQKGPKSRFTCHILPHAHQTVTLRRVIPTMAFQGIYADILPNILSHIYSDILSAILSRIYSGILSHIYSDISSDILF